MSVSRALNDPRDITHNLRTAIIDADGKLVKVYTGNEWTPDQVLADLKTRCPRGLSRLRSVDKPRASCRAADSRRASGG